MKNNILIFGMAALLSCSNAQAQTVKSQNNNIWLHYLGKNMLTKKLSFTFEGSYRFANGFTERQQYFVRPSFDYQLSKRLVGSVGFTHYSTYVYGNPALNKIPIPENHIWFQGQFTHQFGDLRVINRLRDEIRYVGIAIKATDGTYNIDRYDYRNRFRYMLLLNYPLLKRADKSTALFGILGDEVFFNVGSIAAIPVGGTNVGATLLNQNRIIAGIGYNINKQQQLQMSFIQQHIWNFANTIEEQNPTLRLSYITNFSFVKKAP